MEYIRKINRNIEACPYSVSNTSSTLSCPSSSSPHAGEAAAPPPPLILSPCAACKILRRRCVEKCVLTPYFPPTEPLKFTIAHRVFGTSNITKLLQELPEDQREDAVNSMVYEAKERLRDPVYGCIGTICHLQNQNNELQVELAKAQAEILNMQCQNANLSQLISKHALTAQSVHQENILQNQIDELQAELAKAQAEILNMQCQNANLSQLISNQPLTAESVHQENILQNQISELHTELAKAQAEILNMQCQNASSSQLISKQVLTTQNVYQENINMLEENPDFFFDDGNLGASCGSLWS